MSEKCLHCTHKILSIFLPLMEYTQADIDELRAQITEQKQKIDALETSLEQLTYDLVLVLRDECQLNFAQIKALLSGQP